MNLSDLCFSLGSTLRQHWTLLQCTNPDLQAEPRIISSRPHLPYVHIIDLLLRVSGSHVRFLAADQSSMLQMSVGMLHCPAWAALLHPWLRSTTTVELPLCLYFSCYATH
ncbi:hypothetical protein M3J09_012317 [Ascochyta lentis]